MLSAPIVRGLPHDGRYAAIAAEQRVAWVGSGKGGGVRPVQRRNGRKLCLDSAVLFAGLILQIPHSLKFAFADI